MKRYDLDGNSGIMDPETLGQWVEYDDACASLKHMREHFESQLSDRDKRIAELEQALKDLTWRVVANAGRLSEERKPRWSHVSDATAHGSTVSAELCASAGFDPDEDRGGDEEHAHNNGEEP